MKYILDDFLGFFWLEQNIIGGTRLPKTKEELEELSEYGIKRIITIASPEIIQNFMKEANIQFNQLILEIEELGIPSLEQVKSFLHYCYEAKTKEEAIVVHCYAGCGRTGVLLIIYLMYFKKMSYPNALATLRKVRPCAVESDTQYEFLESLNYEKLHDIYIKVF